MNLKKIILVKFAIFILILLVVNIGFSQVKKEETIVYSGTIKSISNDYKFIVIYNENILISSNTKVFDEKGRTLKITDLTPELYVVIEGVPNANGLLAKKIIVKKPPEV